MSRTFWSRANRLTTEIRPPLKVEAALVSWVCRYCRAWRLLGWSPTARQDMGLLVRRCECVLQRAAATGHPGTPRGARPAPTSAVRTSLATARTAQILRSDARGTGQHPVDFVDSQLICCCRRCRPRLPRSHPCDHDTRRCARPRPSRLGRRAGAALRLPPPRARRARLAPAARLPGRHHRGVGQRAVAARPLRQERQAAARRCMGDLVDDRFYADLERDQAERATMSMLVPPQMMNTMVPHAARPARASLDRGVLRRPGPPLHAAGVLRPAYRLAVATRTPPATRCTSTTCGSPRASPTATPPRCWPSCCRPARSTAGTAPGWTSSATRRRSIDKLKFDLKPVDRLRRDDRLPAPHPRRARRRRLRRRRGQHAVARTSRRSSPGCSRSRTSATSGSPPRR